MSGALHVRMHAGVVIYECVPVPDSFVPMLLGIALCVGCVAEQGPGISLSIGPFSWEYNLSYPVTLYISMQVCFVLFDRSL